MLARLGALVLLAGCSWSSPAPSSVAQPLMVEPAPARKGVDVPAEERTTLLLAAPGLVGCGRCAMGVRADLRGLPEIVHIKLSVRTGVIEVVRGPAASTERMLQVLDAAGYPGRVITAEEAAALDATALTAPPMGTPP